MTAHAAATAPGLGTAANFALLSAAPLSGGAVTCSGGSITGNVGSSGARAGVVQTLCPITGTITAPVPAQVVTDFNTAYGAYVSIPCDQVLTGTLAGRTLGPGVYCFDAAATLTGLLTLSGPPNGTWIFKIGTLGTGALTGTGFSVLMAGGAPPCSVNWWSAEATTFTDSFVLGTILSGAAITLTRGTLHGNALGKAAVSTKNTVVTGCTAAGGVPPPGPGCGEQDEDGGQTGHHTGQNADGDKEGCESEDSHQGGDGDHKSKDDTKVETKSTNTHKSKSEGMSD